MKKGLLFLLILASFNTLGEVLDKKIEGLFKGEMNALEKNDYNGFLANATGEFSKLPKTEFEKVASNLSKKLQAGHTDLYLTSMIQNGITVYVWKIGMNDNKNDFMAKMVVSKDGKITGFWLQ